jgi:hypothetical protein
MLELTEVWLLTLYFFRPYSLSLFSFSKFNIMIFQPITRTYKSFIFLFWFSHIYFIEYKRVRRFLSYTFSWSVCGSLNASSSFIFCHLSFKSYTLNLGLFVHFNNRHILYISAIDTFCTFQQ